MINSIIQPILKNVISSVVLDGAQSEIENKRLLALKAEAREYTPEKEARPTLVSVK